MKKFFSKIFTFFKNGFCEVVGFLVAVLGVLIVAALGVITILLVANALVPIGLACGTGFLIFIIINSLSDY